MPWNGLIIFGKRMEPLSRKTQKPRVWDLKLESEYWGLEDAEKTVLKEKSGASQERKNVKPRRSAAGALLASAGLRKGGPKGNVGKARSQRESAGTTTGSRRESGLKEALRFTGVGTSGEDMRSRRILN